MNLMLHARGTRVEIVRERIDVIFDELARLPPLPVAVPVAATHNQQRKCTAAWLYEHPQDAQLYSLGPTCAPSSWYRKMDLGASDHASALPLSIHHTPRLAIRIRTTFVQKQIQSPHE